MNWDTFLDRLADWFDKHELLTPNAGWVVAVSGGLDSTLMLHAMKGLSDPRDLAWKLHVAHFNHGLRGSEADADEHFVATLAEQLGLPFHVEREDIRARYESEGGSLEEVARRHRYDAFARIALKTGCERIAVGHHADDDAETVLHRICRGTGLRGLAGITAIRPIQPGSRIRLIRPFLRHHRTLLKELCNACDFETRTDSTNTSRDFTRNRIRRDILPMLRENLNPNVSDALLRLADQARWLGDYLGTAAARTFDSLVVNEEPGRIVLRGAAVCEKHRAIQSEIVRRAYALVVGHEQDLNFAHVESVVRLAHDNAGGKEIHLPGPVVVHKQYDRLEFHRADEQPPPPEWAPVLIECPGTTPLPALGAEFITELGEIDADKLADIRRQTNPNEEWLDYDRLRLPLTVRGRRPGDRFHPLGAPGAKSVGDFLGDEKIEKARRAGTGLLCDQDGPLWVMPLRIDERAKLTPATRRALRVSLRPTNSRSADRA